MNTTGRHCAIREINVKSILTRSGIPGADYCINPYVGCSHGCRYCYAIFMKRYTGHPEEWGGFVDVKMNAPETLNKQASRAPRGKVIISSVTDAYQPLESRYRITRQCLEILLSHQFSVDILTKSPLVIRDIDLIKKFKNLEVGVSITTEDDRIRKIFEPRAPSIEARIQTLKSLYNQGIKTYAFIGPMLPMNPEILSEKISPYLHSVLIDRMNYVSRTRAMYHDLGLNHWLDRGWLIKIMQRLRKGFTGRRVTICG